MLTEPIFSPATTPHDLGLIEDLAKVIWQEHYLPIIGREQVDYMVGKFQTVQAMQEQLDQGYSYWMIEFGGHTIGYIAYQPREVHLFLSKVYLLKEFRGKGLGRAAMNFVETKAIELGYTCIQLTVNKYNTQTIKAYEKIGFITVQEAVFDIGGGFVMDDYVMEKRGW